MIPLGAGSHSPTPSVEPGPSEPLKEWLAEEAADTPYTPARPLVCMARGRNHGALQERGLSEWGVESAPCLPPNGASRWPWGAPGAPASAGSPPGRSREQKSQGAALTCGGGKRRFSASGSAWQILPRTRWCASLVAPRPDGGSHGLCHSPAQFVVFKSPLRIGPFLSVCCGGWAVCHAGLIRVGCRVVPAAIAPRLGLPAGPGLPPLGAVAQRCWGT